MGAVDNRKLIKYNLTGEEYRDHYGLELFEFWDEMVVLPLGEKESISIKKELLVPIDNEDDLHQLAIEWMNEVNPNITESLDEFLASNDDITIHQKMEGYAILEAF